jgi:hypothetical protein
MTPEATRTEWLCAAALAAIFALVLGSAGPALDQSLSQSQEADLAAAQQRQQQLEERALATLRTRIAAICGNGVPVIEDDGTVRCGRRTPRGR